MRALLIHLVTFSSEIAPPRRRSPKRIQDPFTGRTSKPPLREDRLPLYRPLLTLDLVSSFVFMDLAHVWSFLLVWVFSCVPLVIFPSFPSSCSSCSSQDPLLSWKIGPLGFYPTSASLFTVFSTTVVHHSLLGASVVLQYMYLCIELWIRGWTYICNK